VLLEDEVDWLTLVLLLLDVVWDVELVVDVEEEVVVICSHSNHNLG